MTFKILTTIPKRQSTLFHYSEEFCKKSNLNFFEIFTRNTHDEDLF